jgi:AcrR family transcriptional regulator
MTASHTPRTRDAARSREAILDAAERLFAARGYDGVSLAGIGAAAGVSRGTPGYFFGAKDALYAAVVARVFAARNAALEPAFAALTAWAAAEPGTQERSLEDVLGEAIEGYLTFLSARPTFVALTQREALDGGRRLAAVPHASTVMQDALVALRSRARRHGLADFDVDEVLVALVSLCFMPLAHRDTLLRGLGIDASGAAFVEGRRRQVLPVVLQLLRAPRSATSTCGT